MDNWKDVANSILNAFVKRNQKRLRKINDALLKEAVVNFTSVLYELAVVSYVLSKIVSKPRFLTKENEKKTTLIASSIEDLIRARVEDEALSKCKLIFETIKSLEKDDPRFLIDLVFRIVKPNIMILSSQ